MALLPSYAAGVLHGGPEVYGLLLTGMGLGSALANIGLAARGAWPRRGRMVMLVAVALAASTLALSAIQTREAAFAVITLQGLMQATLLTLTSTLVQSTVDEKMRGRVLSAYMLTWGMTSAGSLLFGSIGSLLGVPAALATAGVMLLAAVAVVRVRLPVIWALE
jgi:MFS family permease